LDANDKQLNISKKPCIWIGSIKGGVEVESCKTKLMPPKIAEALNTLLEAKNVGTQVPYLEGKEIFGSTKRKLDTPIDYAQESH